MTQLCPIAWPLLNIVNSTTSTEEKDEIISKIAPCILREYIPLLTTTTSTSIEFQSKHSSEQYIVCSDEVQNMYTINGHLSILSTELQLSIFDDVLKDVVKIFCKSLFPKLRGKNIDRLQTNKKGTFLAYDYGGNVQSEGKSSLDIFNRLVELVLDEIIIFKYLRTIRQRESIETHGEYIPIVYKKCRVCIDNSFVDRINHTRLYVLQF